MRWIVILCLGLPAPIFAQTGEVSGTWVDPNLMDNEYEAALTLWNSILEEASNSAWLQPESQLALHERAEALQGALQEGARLLLEEADSPELDADAKMIFGIMQVLAGEYDAALAHDGTFPSDSATYHGLMLYAAMMSSQGDLEARTRNYFRMLTDALTRGELSYEMYFPFIWMGLHRRETESPQVHRVMRRLALLTRRERSGLEEDVYFRILFLLSSYSQICGNDNVITTVAIDAPAQLRSYVERQNMDRRPSSSESSVRQRGRRQSLVPSQTPAGIA